MAEKRILYDVTDGSFRWIDAEVVERAMLPLGAPLSDEYYRAIGRITVNFSVLEGAVAQCVGHFAFNSLASSNWKAGIISSESREGARILFRRNWLRDSHDVIADELRSRRAQRCLVEWGGSWR